MPAIMYGVHAATTVVPMLAEFWAGTEAAANPARATLCAIYGAYLIIPLLIALDMAARRIPFPAQRKKKVA